MGSSAADLTTSLLRYERPIVAGSIALLVALSWAFLARGAGMPDTMMMPPPVTALVAMWWLMMVAMMLPSAAPAILLHARVREQRGRTGAIVQPWLFMLGYLSVWLLFSVIAAVTQDLLAGRAMTIESHVLTGGLLLVAGLYQLSPFKAACLRQCRSPAAFLSRHWRPGIAGAVRFGIIHGAYCVGCCWMLMAVLFVGGVMNFAWIAALTLVVGVEKLVPRGDLVQRGVGGGLIAWGLARLFG